MDATAIAYRINALERDIQHLQTQLASYVPARESELQLASIRSTVERIERDLQDTKKEVTGLNTRLTEKLTEQKESQDKLIIKVLWGIVATVISIVTAVAIYFITHPGG
ncbi:MAG: hypothetical protein AUI84_02840 [Delftia sp. 13_1_40CM_3_66_6]|nr:MAG: hypothetical protein AUI84_02840 [Delftia sp. 13_1_40CM_3_66_6]